MNKSIFIFASIFFSHLELTSSAPTVIEAVQNTLWIEYEFPDSENITISVTVKEQGFVAIGFGSSMTDTDMLVGWFENGAAVVQDLWSKGHGRPSVDASNDITFSSGKRTPENTTFTFRRKLDTGDINDTAIIPNRETPMCYSFGTSDKFTKHEPNNHGTFKAVFFKLNAICHESCVTCSGLTDKDCVSCASGKLLLSGSCVTESSSNCSSTCRTCSGPGAAACLSCDPARLLFRGFCIPNDVSLPSSYATMDSAGLTLYWQFEGDEVIMALVSRNEGWFAIGAGQSMIDSDIILVEINESGGVGISDCYSTAREPPSKDELRGGTNDLVLLGRTEFVNNQRIVKFKRKAVTQDKLDRSFEPNGEFQIIAARKGDSHLSFHEKQFWIYSVNFVQGFQGKAQEVDKIIRNLIKAHEALNLLGWGFLADIGIFAARNLRHNKFYLIIHLVCFIITDFGSVLIGMIMLAKLARRINEISQEGSLFTAHIGFGMALLILSSFQHVCGIVLKQRYLEATGAKTQLYVFKNFHKVSGYIIYLIAKTNILIGFNLSGDSMKFATFLPIFLIQLLIHVKSHFLYSLQSRRLCKKRKSVVLQRKGEEQVQLLNWIEKQSKYFIPCFDLPEHINYGVGRDVDRYLHGVCGLEDLNMKAHPHSIYAFDILDARLIGSLQSILPTPIAGCDLNYTKTWKIASKRVLTKTTSLFLFESSECKIKNFLEGVSWIGRHCAISAKGNESTVRLYTMVLCLTAENEEYRQYLIAAYDFFKSNGQLSNSGMPKLSEFSRHLPFIIKKYQKPRSFSSFLHESKAAEFHITGPIGRGLELRADLAGTVYIFAGGTGILPFLDLFDYLLKKAIHTLSLKHRLGLGNWAKENFIETFETNFKVVLFAAFDTFDDFFGSSFILKLSQISRSEALDIFDMVVRIKDGTQLPGVPAVEGYFDDGFVGVQVDNTVLRRAYVCGPPKMIRSVSKALSSVGVEEGKIFIV